MARPTTKAELIAAAEHELDRLWAAVETVPPEAREVEGACEAWSVKDVLAHLHAWHLMVLEWHREGMSGGDPAIPAEGFTWADIPALNHQIHLRHRDDPWDDVVAALRRSHGDVMALVEAQDEADLFVKGRHAWTGATSVGAYLVSATSSHYAWASKLLRRWARTCRAPAV
jgi:hypothetical protein